MTTLYLIYHIPKTGGVSLREQLERHMRLHEEIVHIAPHGIARARRAGFLPLEQRSPEQLQRIRVLVGHDLGASMADLVPHDERREILFLRDPAALTISRYNYRMSLNSRLGEDRVIPFEVWLSEQGPDFQLRHLLRCFALREDPTSRPSSAWLESACDELIERLERVWFTGCTEEMDRCLPALCRAMNVPAEGIRRANATGVKHQRRIVADEALKQSIRSFNERDARLHDWALGRLDEQLSAIE